MGGKIRSDKCVDVKWHWIVTSAPSGILSERCCCFFHQIKKNIIPFWLIINKYGEIMSWFVSSHYDHHYFPHEGCMKVIESMQHRTFHAFSTTKNTNLIISDKNFPCHLCTSRGECEIVLSASLFNSTLDLLAFNRQFRITKRTLQRGIPSLIWQ